MGFDPRDEVLYVAYLMGGRRWFFRTDDPWLWSGDLLARLRGALLIERRGEEPINLLLEDVDHTLAAFPRALPIPGIAEGTYPCEDLTHEGPKMGVVFRDRPDLRAKHKLSLTPETLARQSEAAAALATKGGYLSAPPGFGKTRVGVEAICLKGFRALILVNTEHLLHQWRDSLLTFTTLREDEILFLQGAASVRPGAWETKKVAVAMAQTLNHLPDDHPVFKTFGIVVLDEAHECPAVVLYQTILRFTARHVWAMTATPARTDGLWFMVPWIVGGCAYSVAPMEFPTVRLLDTTVRENTKWYGTYLRDENGEVVPLVTEDGPVLNKDGSPKGVVDSQAYRSPRGARDFWPYLVNYLTASPARQFLLAGTILDVLADERTLILLSDRRSQLEDLFSCWLPEDVRRMTGVITADTPMDVRKQMGKEKRVLLATMGCLKKGADFPRFDTLLYGTPFSSAVTAVQTAGRVLSRNNPNKKPPLVIVPYDQGVSSSARCVSSFVKRATEMRWKFEITTWSNR